MRGIIARRASRTIITIAFAASLAAAPASAQDAIPAEFAGDWVPAAGGCDAKARLRVGASELTLVNGADARSWGNVAIAHSFFGPDYTGISVVALPDYDGEQPFTLYFNADEKPGVARVDIYHPMQGPQNAQVQAIQAKAKALAQRFPIDHAPLKKCPPK